MWSYVKIIIWGLCWLPVWVITLAWKKSRDNCLAWSLKKFDTEGGYLVIRWCRSNKIPFVKWPHFLWLPEEHHVHLRHIIPTGEVNDDHKLPVPWFTPEERVGDPKSSVGDN